jgi:hypothetical protein
MGQTMAKYFPSPTPYGASPNVGAVGPETPQVPRDSTPGALPSPDANTFNAGPLQVPASQNQLKLKLPYQVGTQ